MAGLNRLDSLVLGILCEFAIGTEFLSFSPHNIQQRLADSGVSESGLNKTIGRLDAHGVLHVQLSHSGEYFFVKLDNSTFLDFARENLDYVEQLQTSILDQLINTPANHAIAVSPMEPYSKSVHRALLQEIADNGWIKVSWSVDGTAIVSHISPLIEDMA